MGWHWLSLGLWPWRLGDGRGAYTASGGFGLLRVFVFVGLIRLSDMPVKVIVSVVVIVLNYVASKVWVFRG